MKFIHSPNAPEAIGPYSQAILVEKTLYVSGQTPINPRTKKVDATEIKSQTLQCLQNLEAIVVEAGMKKENIVKCGVFLKDMNMFKDMNEVYKNFFGEHKPARVTVEVARLPLDALVEIDCTAVK
ncbi:MAG: RidA family protein [Candidatus Izemoplasmatales bacterium]|jgi:2-iminobutanoate/2-iminopropanoate deaminase|nr:RidA family protein [Candidatus Izemoplasmatales bacterium]HPD99660.1 RidA family protein [Bacillota bacterium]